MCAHPSKSAKLETLNQSVSLGLKNMCFDQNIFCVTFYLTLLYKPPQGVCIFLYII